PFLLFFLPLIPPPPTSTLFPYTTLFRSRRRTVRRRVQYRLSLHRRQLGRVRPGSRSSARRRPRARVHDLFGGPDRVLRPHRNREDRKSTRLNSSHVKISYAVFCLKKKKQ